MLLFFTDIFINLAMHSVIAQRGVIAKDMLLSPLSQLVSTININNKTITIFCS